MPRPLYVSPVHLSPDGAFHTKTYTTISCLGAVSIKRSLKAGHGTLSASCTTLDTPLPRLPLLSRASDHPPAHEAGLVQNHSGMHPPRIKINLTILHLNDEHENLSNDLPTKINIFI